MTGEMSSILWRRLRYSLTPQFDIYRQMAGIIAGNGVLEVGFGTGFGTLQYAHRASFVDAIEPDPDAVAFAKTTLPIPNVTWLQGDICTYNTHKRYAYVLMVETLEHIEDWEKALANIKAHLLPEGILYMTARNANADLSRWVETHLREWTAQEAKANLGKFFSEVYLYDWSIQNPQKEDTRVTPLVIAARL